MNKKYRYQYIYQLCAWGEPEHKWAIIGAGGGMHVWIRRHTIDGREEYCGGVELHSRTPLYGDTAPDHDHCWLLKTPCWHDGSSLQAEEIWIPRWRQDPHNHDQMFEYLMRAMDERFAVPER